MGSSTGEATTIRVVICGGGNAAHVLMALLGARESCRVQLVTTFGDEAQRWRGGRLVCTHDFDGLPPLEVHVKTEQICGSVNDPHFTSCSAPIDIVLLAVPAFAHEAYMDAILPLLDRDREAVICALPGEGGFDWCVWDAWRRLHPEAGDMFPSRWNVVALDTLPWACRIQSYGERVDILGTKKFVDVCSNREDASIVATLQSLFTPCEGQNPALIWAGCHLNATMMNINAIWHPTITYGQYRDWDGKTPFPAPGPLFYEGVDDFTAEQLTLMSDEVLRAKQILLERFPSLKLDGVRHVREWMKRAYGEDIADTTSLRTMLNSNKGYQRLRHPMRKTELENQLLPEFRYRYMTEDLPCGLVVIRGICELAGVVTPAIDTVIKWCQYHAGKSYLVNGQLQGSDLNISRCPQRYGFTSLDTLFQTMKY